MGAINNHYAGCTHRRRQTRRQPHRPDKLAGTELLSQLACLQLTSSRSPRRPVRPCRLRPQHACPHRSLLAVAPASVRCLCARINCRLAAALPRLRSPLHGLCPRLAASPPFAIPRPRPRLAAFSSAPTAARRLHCRIPSLPLRLPQQSLRTPPSPAAATVRAAALLSNAHQQGLQHSRCSV